MNPRQVLQDVFNVAVDAARGDLLLRRHSTLDGNVWRYQNGAQRIAFDLPNQTEGGRLIVLGAGKAAASLAQGLQAVLADRIDDGDVVVKYGHALPLARIRVHEAAHPVPDAAGEVATRAVIRQARAASPQDRVIVLLTGGASALLVAPAPGITLADKARANELLVRSGASIQDINVVRKHLSTVKGGQLGRILTRAPQCTLAISDVLGDDLATIASGPTVADPSTYEDALGVLATYDLLDAVPASVRSHLARGALGEEPETPKVLGDRERDRQIHVLASNAQALAAMAKHAESLDIDVFVLPEALRGNTHDAATHFANEFRQLASGVSQGANPKMLIAGGETTLRVTGSGLGGRSQEFALRTAIELRGKSRFALLAAGTDGTDGPTPAAGAFIDATTLARAATVGVDVSRTLRQNDSYRFFKCLGDLLVTGPTGTNVMDIVVAVTY